MLENVLLRAKWDAYASDPGYQAEALLININEQIAKRMDAKNISYEELARRLHRTPTYVKNFLAGRPRVTLIELVLVANAIGVHVEVRLQ